MPPEQRVNKAEGLIYLSMAEANAIA